VEAQKKQTVGRNIPTASVPFANGPPNAKIAPTLYSNPVPKDMQRRVSLPEAADDPAGQLMAPDMLFLLQESGISTQHPSKAVKHRRPRYQA